MGIQLKSTSLEKRMVPEKCRKPPETAGKVPETAGKTPQKKGGTENENAILNFLSQHEKITRKDVEELIAVKDRRAREILSEMVKNGVLKKEGKSRNIYYTKK